MQIGKRIPAEARLRTPDEQELVELLTENRDLGGRVEYVARFLRQRDGGRLRELEVGHPVTPTDVDRAREANRRLRAMDAAQKALPDAVAQGVGP